MVTDSSRYFEKKKKLESGEKGAHEAKRYRVKINESISKTWDVTTTPSCCGHRFEVNSKIKGVV